MPKQIIIAEQHRIAAVFSEDQIQEIIVATGSHQVGDIYLGVVENVLPGIDAAFVNIGDTERNGFIHVSDLGPLRLRRTAGSITELLAPQQKVLVQIMKEPTGNKGPRLTGNVSLPGRYLVLMPFGRGVNLSRRIRNESERNRLRALAILIKPAGMGLLVRTEAEGVAEEAILEDLELLQKQWESIQQQALSTRPPRLLNRDDDFIQRVLRDVYSADVNRIVVDSHTGVKRVKQHLMNWSGGRSPQGVLIDHHNDRISILEYFRVNAAIREALKPRVDLPSGGYIIIERTEALTVIDVNSGSFTRSATARETVLWTNCEAATEIARQLRLRNIAGVIVVDFIDMDSRRDQLQVLENFNKAIRSDKSRPQIAQLTELGLVELTRKRQGQNIYELFGQTCPTCGGLGHLVHLPGEAEKSIAEQPIDMLRAASSVPQTRVAPPQPMWDEVGEESDLDALADTQDLDLLNHPSYQERGKGDRRRRRSRLRVGETVAKGSSNRLELEDEAETNGIADVPFSREPSLALPVKEGRPEKQERAGRSPNRREKQPPEPPQFISVEMTPEEQDIYALMGISPLVLASEPIKDPKSVIISVALPGQRQSPPNGATPATFQMPERPPAIAIAEPVIQERFEPVEVEPEPIQAQFDEAEPAVVETPAAPEPEGYGDDNSSSVRRRRRRRSSVNSDSTSDSDS